jgi:hypothetical protein
MKVGAGTTAVHQACDRAQTFKATKKGEGSIEDMQNRNCVPTNEFLKGQIQKAFSTFSETFPSAKPTAILVARFTDALIVISHVYVTKVMILPKSLYI